MEKEYKITIEELTYQENNKYPDKKEIFTQVIKDGGFDLSGIVKAVNNFPTISQ